MIRWLLLFGLVAWMVYTLFHIHAAVFPEFSEHHRFADEQPGCLSVPAKVSGELKFYRVELCDGELTMMHPNAYADLAGK